MQDGLVDILMYHSISERGGPTSIPPAVFADQMQALADSGLAVLSMDDVVAARTSKAELPKRAVVITFDDGFQDFAETAWPILVRHGFPALVYIPTDHVGGCEAWRGAVEPPRKLMSWNTIRQLAKEGAHFGSHTLTHPDLESLSPDELETELAASREALEEELGRPVPHFAPPYGRAGPDVRRAIARHYDSSASTELGQASPDDELLNLPRLEMFYFRAPGVWRAHIAGRGRSYLFARKAMRHVREQIHAPWNR